MREFSINDPILRRIIYILGILGIVIAGFHAGQLAAQWIVPALQVLSPFLAAFLLAYILAPLVETLQRKFHLGPLTGTVAVYLLMVFLLAAILTYLVPLILTQVKSLVDSLKEGLPALLSWLSERKYLDKETVDLVKDKLDDWSIDYNRMIDPLLTGLEKLASGGYTAVEELTSRVAGGVHFVFELLFFLVFVFIINFYLMSDWGRIGPFMEKMIPDRHHARFFDILGKIDRAMGGFLRGQLLVALLVGTSFATGLFIIGLIGFPALSKYCLIIGIVAGLGGFIPYLGPILGVTPALLIVAFSQTPDWSTKIVTLLVVLTLFGAIQALEGLVLQPKIVGKGAGLHPLLVLLAMLVGARFGIGGMIVAVPFASVLKVLTGELIHSIQKKEQA
jgi:predicted PurR-regulated permease PerM